MPARDINQDGEQQGLYQEHHHPHQLTVMEQQDKEEESYYDREADQEEEPKMIAIQTQTDHKQHETTLSPTSLCNHYSTKALPSCPPATPPPFKKSAQHARSSSASSSIMERVWGEPPYDIQRPNCVPGFGPFDITTFKDDPREQQQHDDEISIQSFLDSSTLEFDDDDDNDMYGTKQSHTPSSSGDSGYGTRRKNRKRSSSSIQPQSTKTIDTNGNKVQNLFEALFAPVTTSPTTAAHSPPSLKIHPTSSKSSTAASLTGTSSSRGSNRRGSITSPTKKLSLLFSKSRASHQPQSKEPHFVKYQTWSNNNDKHNKPSGSPTTSNSIRRPHEEHLFKSHNHVIMEEQELLPPPTIKIQEPISTKQSSVQQQQPLRGRRRTDAALIRVKSEILTPPSIVTTPPPALPKSTALQKQHGRCKSIGSFDLLSPATPNTAVSLISPTIQENSNILDHCDQDGNMIARYVSVLLYARSSLLLLLEELNQKW